jgi:hypothetical protein
MASTAVQQQGHLGAEEGDPLSDVAFVTDILGGALGAV